MFIFLIQKGIAMKSLMKVTYTALLFTGIMTGCNGSTHQNKKKALLKRVQCTMEKYLKTNT